MTSDIVIHSARIFDGLALVPGADAVAIRDGVVTHVGAEVDVRREAGSAVTVIDAAGGLLTPGFTDAHVHPVQGGYERLHCDLTDSRDAEHALSMIAEYAAAHPDDEWIVGGGWHMDHFDGGMPATELLEQVAPGRRILLSNADHHGAWASPAALVAAGIDADTPDPPSGHIDRRADGSLQGTFQESAVDLFADHLPAASTVDYVAALGEAERYLHSVGVTGWQDAIIGEDAGFADSTEAYLAAIDSGLLSSTITGALWLPRGLTIDAVPALVADMVERRERVGVRRNAQGGSFRLTSIKIMQDGVPESRTAAMKSPYLDGHGHATEVLGPSHFSQSVLTAAAVPLALAGFQLHIHAIGDRAVAEALEALEAARAAGDDGSALHHLAHLQQVDLRDLDRFVAVGATANLQALWACRSDQMVQLNLPIVGVERFEQQYPFGSMLRAGIPLAMGSDWPVSTPDPWQAIHVAVNRREPGRTAQRPLGAGEAIGLRDALAAYTSGSARVTHAPAAGRLVVGGRADLALANVDPFDSADADLHATRNVATVVAGRLTHLIASLNP